MLVCYRAPNLITIEKIQIREHNFINPVVYLLIYFVYKNKVLNKINVSLN